MGIAWRGLTRALVLLVVLLGATAQAGTLQYVYDGLGRLIAVVDETGATTTYAYDAAGNILAVSGGGAGSAQLAILSFAPDHGKAGDSVSIFGSKFIAVPAQNAVAFNGTPAVVTSATTTALVVTVPAGVTNGPITVSNTNGNATSAGVFTVVDSATITGVTPNLVAAGATTRVQISGSSLRYATAVTFSQAGITASIVQGITTNQLLTIDLKVASNVLGARYQFTVVDAAGSTSSGAVTVGVGSTGDFTTVGSALSVFLPAQLPPPAGAGASVSPTTSVFLPQTSPIAPPAGNSVSVGRPTSVSMP